MMQKIAANARGFATYLSVFLSALYLAWLVNAALGYGYSWLHSYYKIEQHIAHYAPQNRFREGFEQTSVADHHRLFQQIVDSVHHQGRGLSEISYQYQQQVVPLLHHEEVVHLQDVASLIDVIHGFGLVVLVLALGLVARTRYLRSRNKECMSPLGVMSVMVFVLCLVGFWVAFIGPREIFYQLHVMIFPEDHAWFFYYQDSLMSTLMKAPDLFAGIAVQILGLGIVLFAAFYYYLLRHRI